MLYSGLHCLFRDMVAARAQTEGIRGRVTYECVDASPVCLAALHWLARLAMYSGVGYQTPRGMGAVMTKVGD